MMLVIFSSLLFILNINFLNAAEPSSNLRKNITPSYLSKASTTMQLSSSKGKIYLDVKSSPEKMIFYSGKRQLGSLVGKNRTRFDITVYAMKAEKGLLRVVTYDDKGKKTDRILNVSSHIKNSASSKAVTTSTPKQAFRTLPKEKEEQKKPPVSAGKYQRKPTQTGKGVSSSINVFLDKIERANSIEDLRRSYNEVGFSKRESNQLADAIKDPRYLDKLKNIANREISKWPVNMSQQKQKPGKDYPKKSPTVTKTHTQRLQKIRKDIALQKTRINTRDNNTFIVRDRQSLTELSSSQSSMLSPPVRSSPSWVIDSVSPSSVQIGSNVTLTGSGFGVSRGLVALRFDDRTSGLRALVNCDRIVSWSDNRIIVTIPADAAGVVGDTNTNASIWVKVAGGEVGPWSEITLHPDFSLLPPEIGSVSHNDVIPDQPFLIQGKNFLSSQQGEVFFRFAGKDFPAIISSWGNELIEVQVPPIVGLLRTPGSVLVRNHARYDAFAVVTFLPKIEGDWVWGPGDTGYFDPHDASNSLIHVRCTPWFGGGLDDHNPAWLLCVFGQERRNHIRISLNNGWKFRSARIDLENWDGWNNSHNCGAYFEREPTIDSDKIDAIRVAWTNAYSRCEFNDFYEVEGPAGLSWMADSDYRPELACIDTVNREEELSFYRDSPVNCRNVRGW